MSGRSSSPAFLGLDWGDAPRRAAVSHEGKSSLLALPMEAREPTVVFDPQGGISTLGVGFPTLLASVGRGLKLSVGKRLEGLEMVLERQIAAARAAAERAAPGAEIAAAMAVPALLGQRSRKALLDACRAAGLEKVTLLDACTAAAMGHLNPGEGTSTALVYHLGYGDCEYALVRVARGKTKVISSGAVARVSGEMFDAVMIESIVLALRKSRIILGLKGFTGLQWLELLDIARTARRTLLERPEVEVALPPALTGLDSTVRLKVAADGFHARMLPLVESTIDHVHALLEQSELRPEDIDQWVLVGEEARSDPVTRVIRGHAGEKLVVAAPASAAHGALRHASQAFGAGATPPAPPPSTPAHPPEETGRRIAQETPRGGDQSDEADFVRVEAGEGAETTRRGEPGRAGGMHVGEPISVEFVQSLIAARQYEEAATALESLEKSVARLKEEIVERSMSGPRRLIQAAAAALASGLPEKAVGLAHTAYGEAPRDPEVFAGMMRVHVEAGQALDRPEDYETSVRFLLCAYRHDQTDRAVHKALAERHLRHAVALRRLNNLSGALKAAETALEYDPNHAEARSLHRELTAPPAS